MENRKRGKRRHARPARGFKAVVSWLKAPRSKPALKLVAIDLAKMVGLSLFVVLVHWYLNTHPSGGALRDFQFSLLRAGLMKGALDTPGSQAGGIDMPVVFDVSRLHPNKALPTDRVVLDQIIEELDGSESRGYADRENGPKGVGVDIEFAENMETNTLDRPEDYEYLSRWKGKLHGNVRVGVYRRALKRSQFWLGLPDFRDMAVGISLPKGDPNHAFLYSRTCFKKRRQQGADLLQTDHNRPLEDDVPVKCEAERDTTVERDNELIQLPTAMYIMLHGAVGLTKLKNQSLKSPDSQLLELGEYFIDYSYLKQIQSEIVVPSSLADIPALVRNLRNRGGLKNRVVLIGDLEDVSDQFCQTPSQRPLAGVLIHACSIATLNRVLLPELEGWRSTLLELAIIVFLLCSIVGVRLWYYYSPVAHQWDYQYIEILLFGTMAMAIYIAFKLRIRDVGWVWPKFLWVSAALFIHPFLTEPFYRTCVALPKMLQAFCGVFARRDSGGNHDR